MPEITTQEALQSIVESLESIAESLEPISDFFATADAALQEHADTERASPASLIRAYKKAADKLDQMTDLSDLSGFGDRLLSTITILRAGGKCAVLDDLRATTTLPKRYPYAEARKLADSVVETMKKKFPEAKVEVAGSLRRGKDPRDIDILVAADGDSSKLTTFFRSLGTGLDVGEKSTAFTMDGIKIEMRAVPLASYGAGMLFFTGSADFNIRIRGIAKKKGWKLSRYSLHDAKTEKPIASETEREILDLLGVGWVVPKDRIG
jgi:hypothetical protein